MTTDQRLGRSDGPELIDVAIDTEEPSVKQVTDYESTVDLV